MKEELIKILLEFESKKAERNQPFLADTDDKKQYIEYLFELQDHEYITGITDNGVEQLNRSYTAYILSSAKITQKGRDFIKSVSC